MLPESYVDEHQIIFFIYCKEAHKRQSKSLIQYYKLLKRKTNFASLVLWKEGTTLAKKIIVIFKGNL